MGHSGPTKGLKGKCPDCLCPKCKGVKDTVLGYCADPDESLIFKEALYRYETDWQTYYYPNKREHGSAVGRCKVCKGTGKYVSARRRLVLSGDRPAADTPSPSGNNPSPS